MAYDPQARRQGKTALVVGICALLLLGGGAIAYFASQPAPPAETAGPTIIRSEKETLVVQPTPLPQPLPDQVVVVPGPTQAPVVNKETIIREREVPVPAPRASGSEGSSTNVTVNNVAPQTQPAPAANGSGSSGSNNSGNRSSSSGASNGDAATSSSPAAGGNTSGAAGGTTGDGY